MNSDFWKLTSAAVFLTSAMYMLVFPMLPFLTATFGLSRLQAAVVIGIPGIAAFTLGVFCSYLIQRYRRNKVCTASIVIVAAAMLFMAYVPNEYNMEKLIIESPVILIAARFVMGAFFGLALMVINGTLVIDSCVSQVRTKANVISSWAHLAAVPLGAVIGILVYSESGIRNVFYTSATFCLIAAGVISSIRFPFKAPEENLHKCSTDRFLVRSGMPIIISAIGIGVSAGSVTMEITAPGDFPLILSGMLISVLSLCLAYRHKYVKATGKAELLSGRKNVLSLSVAGYVLLVFSVSTQNIALLHTPDMLILGVSLPAVLTAVHCCFIETADHCRRGSAVSTYYLMLELGIYTGIFIHVWNPCLVQYLSCESVCSPAIAAALLSALSFFIFVRRHIAGNK